MLNVKLKGVKLICETFTSTASKLQPFAPNLQGFKNVIEGTCKLKDVFLLHVGTRECFVA